MGYLKYGVFSLLLALLPFILVAQTQVTGVIQCAENQQVLSFSTLTPLDNRSHAIRADADGHYIISFPSGSVSQTFIVSCLGYKSDTIVISSLTPDLTIQLKEERQLLEEIVITGGTRETILRENPLAISIVSGKSINRTGESNLIESLTRHVPGLNTVTTGPNISKPFIRGLGYNRVLTLFDGVRQEGQQWGDEHGLEVDSYNVEKAEVIKGPASLLYGSDALAGVVSLFPVIPKDTDGKVAGNFISEYQSNNGLIGNGARLSSGGKKWSWMSGFSLRKAKNYTNRVDGPVYNTGYEEKNFNVMFRRAVKAGDSRLNLTYYDDLQGIPDGSRDSLSRNFTLQSNEGTADNIKERPEVTREKLFSYQLSPLRQHIRHFRAYANNRYQVGAGDMNFTLGFQQNIRQEFNHPSRPEQAGLFVRLNTINYSLRYNAPAVAGVELSAGVNGMIQRNKNKDATDFPIPDYGLGDIGLFGFVNWRHGKWSAGGGYRYDYRLISADDFYVRTNSSAGFPAQAHFPDIAGAVLQIPSLHQFFGGGSFGAGATLSLSDHLYIKANISRGYRAPNIAEIASNGLDPGAHIVYVGNRNFHPEFSLQEDLAITSSWRSVTASASLFNTSIRNYIYLRQLVDENGSPVELVHGNKTFKYQQGSARLFGFEGSVDYHPSVLKGFSLSSHVSLVIGENTEKDFRGKGLQGQYLPFIPPLKFLSTVKQEFATRFRLVPNWNMAAGFDCISKQRKYLALYGTETSTAGYVLVNFSAGADIRYSGNNVMHLQFQVNNAFDEIWQSNLSRLKYFEYYKSSPSGYTGMYGMGRNYCVKLTVPFVKK